MPARPGGIEQLFAAQLAAGLHRAAALAVYVDGRLEVDLQAGHIDPAGKAEGVISLSDIARHDKVFAADTLRLVSSREVRSH